MTAEPHEHRDPLLDAPRKKKLSTGAMVGIAISVIVHVLGKN
jgi:protein TonB